MKRNNAPTFGKWLEIWINTYKKPYLAESGININVTQNLVGHKTLNTTLSIYTHISIDFARSEFAKFKA